MLASPQTSALAVKNSAGNGDPIHILKENPIPGVADDPIIGGRHEGSGDAEGDGGVLALPAAEDGVLEKEPSRRHVDDGGAGRGARLGPRGEQGLA